jgi:hypothetical protein
MISAKQLAAKRAEQDQALDLNRQQIVSAFIGEIDVILNELHEFLRPAIGNPLGAVESGGKEVNAEIVRIGRHLGRIFNNSPIRVRLLPKPISGELMRFYYLLEETKKDLDWYCRAIGMQFNHRVRIMKPMQLARLRKQILTKLHSCENLGLSLLGELKKIRDTEIARIAERSNQPPHLAARLRLATRARSWLIALVSFGRAAKLRLAIHARSQLNQLILFARAAKLRLAVVAPSWLNGLISFARSAKLSSAVRIRSWLSQLTWFARVAELRLGAGTRSWLSRRISFARRAKLRVAVRAQSWLSRLIPFARAAKLRLVVRGRSWLNGLISFARAAKVSLAVGVRSWLSQLISFARTAEVRLAMRARWWLGRHAIQGPHPLGQANQKEGMMAQSENAAPLTQEPPRELSELPARNPPTNQVKHARLRLVSFAFVRFLSIFIAGVVVTLAWESWGGAALKAIDGAAKVAICARSTGSQEKPDMTLAPSPSPAKPVLPTRTPSVH